MREREIAKELSGPMRTALCRMAQNYCYCDGRSLAALVRRGLCAHVASDPELLGDLCAITALGRKVAAILSEEHKYLEYK